MELKAEAIETVRNFFATFSSGARPLLLLDYDGTLAPFQVDRFQAHPWPGLRELLQRIQQQGRTQMIVITGRPAEEIAPLLALDTPLEVWGLHGTERLYPDGHRELETLAPTVRHALDDLRAHLLRDSLGGLFEEKANGAVMHWRGASPAQAAEIERRTRALFAPLAAMDGLELLEFESGLELRAGRNKGGAVDAILREQHGRPVAFLGDDITDEHAFRAVNRAQSPHLTALVRPEWRETAADIWLQPPGQLIELLSQWLNACVAVGR